MGEGLVRKVPPRVGRYGSSSLLGRGEKAPSAVAL